MKRYIVLGRDNCKYCMFAKQLLTRERKPFEYYLVNTPEGRIILNYFKDIIPKDYHYVPKILEVDEKFIGGFDSIFKKIMKEKKRKKSRKIKKKNNYNI